MKTGLRHSQVRTSLVVLACLIGSKGVAFPETPLGASDSQPTITVQVYNYSRASLAVVADAEREAGRILGTAGLKTVWLECPVAPVSGSDQVPARRLPKLLTSGCEFWVHRPDTNSRTPSSDSPCIPSWPVFTSTMLHAAPTTTTPNSKPRSFWAAP